MIFEFDFAKILKNPELIQLFNTANGLEGDFWKFNSNGVVVSACHPDVNTEGGLWDADIELELGNIKITGYSRPHGKGGRVTVKFDEFGRVTDYGGWEEPIYLAQVELYFEDEDAVIYIRDKYKELFKS